MLMWIWVNAIWSLFLFIFNAMFLWKAKGRQGQFVTHTRTLWQARKRVEQRFAALAAQWPKTSVEVIYER